MSCSAFRCLVCMLGLLTVGCEEGPALTQPQGQATSEAEKVTSEVAPQKLPAEADEATVAAGSDIMNSIGMKLVFMPAGDFVMGTRDSEPYAFSNERPQHRVRITRPFYLGATEVTQTQWQRVMGNNPSHFIKSGPDAPVESMLWDEAREFCRKLSELPEETKAGRRYRLPTEAEWEYACRAGSIGRYCCGDSESLLGDYAWYSTNSEGKTHEVGRRKPNAWGLFDMHGNVGEWCADWYDGASGWRGIQGPPSKYYANSPAEDPMGPSGGSDRVVRGGSVRDSAQTCRAASRDAESVRTRGFYVGLRVSLVRAGDE